MTVPTALRFEPIPWLLWALALGACTPVAEEPESLLERGRYLVDHVADCHACHTPKRLGGDLDETRLLAGIDCVHDTEPEMPGRGCIHSANLTDHPTGLRNRTDAEIEDMLRHGLRIDDAPMHPLMPYWMYAHLEARDLRAIIAYLRSVPGVAHRVKPNEPPHDRLDRPAAPLDLTTLAEPSADHGAAATRGRYLATAVARCLLCHTPAPAGVPAREALWQIDLDRAFIGGRSFLARDLGLPVPPFPGSIETSNLTPDASGLAEWSVDDIVHALQHGRDVADEPLCPPMPAGPDRAYGGLRDEDARAIAEYLRHLPPRENEVVPCMAPRGRD